MLAEEFTAYRSKIEQEVELDVLPGESVPLTVKKGEWICHCEQKVIAVCKDDYFCQNFVEVKQG